MTPSECEGNEWARRRPKGQPSGTARAPLTRWSSRRPLGPSRHERLRCHLAQPPAHSHCVRSWGLQPHSKLLDFRAAGGADGTSGLWMSISAGMLLGMKTALLAGAAPWPESLPIDDMPKQRFTHANCHCPNTSSATPPTPFIRCTRRAPGPMPSFRPSHLRPADPTIEAGRYRYAGHHCKIFPRVRRPIRHTCPPDGVPKRSASGPGYHAAAHRPPCSR